MSEVISSTDPLLDAEYEKCETCGTKKDCGLYASGHVVECNIVSSGIVEEYSNIVPFANELRLDDKLESKFNRMMGVPRKSHCGV
jgi:hypothetical protein